MPTDTPTNGATDLADAAPTDQSPEPEAPETPETTPEKAEAVEKTPETKEQVAEKAAAESRSKQLAAIMRQEAELRRQKGDYERKHKELESQYSAKFEHLQEQLKSVEEFRKNAFEYMDRVKADPVGWLQEEFGIDPERYYETVLNDKKPTKDHVLLDNFKNLQSQYQKLEQRLAAKEKAEEDARKNWEEQQRRAKEEAEEAARQAEVTQAQEDFWTLISGNAKDFEALNYEAGGERLYPKEVLLQGAAEYVSSLGAKASEMSYTDLAREMETSARAWLSRVRGVNVDAPKKEEAKADAAVPPPTPAESKFTKTRRAAGSNGAPIKTKTLTPDLSAQRASAKVGRSWEEEKEALKRELSGP